MLPQIMDLEVELVRLKHMAARVGVAIGVEVVDAVLVEGFLLLASNDMRETGRIGQAEDTITGCLC